MPSKLGLSMIMNASGCHCRNKTQLDNLVNAGMTTIITKTCTFAPNKGNPEPCFEEVGDNVSVNCLGMPNLGYTYYRDLYLEYQKKGITYIISMDASNIENLQNMLLDYDNHINKLKIGKHVLMNVLEYVEINISCPSTTCPRIISYDILAFARLLETIKSLELVNLVIGLKLAPYIDKILLSQIASLIIKYQSTSRIAYIVCSNSIPNGMILDMDTGQPKLSAKTGGTPGVVNKLLGVANIWQFNEIFKKHNIVDIKLIGCGGVENEEDIREYFLAGAHSVQIGRALYTGGAEVLASLNKELHSSIILSKL